MSTPSLVNLWGRDIGFLAGADYDITLDGHLLLFAALVSIGSASALLYAVIPDPVAWALIRCVYGFTLAGFYMIVESWLSERAEPQTRGRIFGIYTMVNLVASTGGQMTLSLGDTTGYLFFVLAAMFYCLALVPTAISSSVAAASRSSSSSSIWSRSRAVRSERAP